MSRIPLRFHQSNSNNPIVIPTTGSAPVITGNEIATAATAAVSASVSAASISASKAAATELVLPALDDQQKQLENLSKQFLTLYQNLEKKISHLNETLKNQPEPVIRVASPKVDITGDFNELQTILKRLNTNLIEGQNKIVNMRDKKFLKDLETTNSDAYNMFSSRVCDIEEKVKDIRSLLLAQTMNSSDNVISSSVKIHEAAKEAAKAVEKSHENVYGMVHNVESSVELSLREHEERLNGQLIATGVAMAIFVPLVSYIINKFL